MKPKKEKPDLSGIYSVRSTDPVFDFGMTKGCVASFSVSDDKRTNKKLDKFMNVLEKSKKGNTIKSGRK